MIDCSISDIGSETRSIEIADESDFDVEIMIDAQNEPERRANLDTYTERLVQRFSRIKELENCSFFVWVRLLPASFGTHFPPGRKKPV